MTTSWRGITWLAGVLCAPLAQAQLLAVERLSGTAQLTRNGLATTVTLAEPVVDQDFVKVGTDSQLTLRLGTHGFVDLGPGAELSIERLPYARFAEDLRTVLRLQKGYLRVVWNYPPSAAPWPLFVHVGPHHAQLSSGEFFFETGAPTATACAANGQLHLIDEHNVSTPLTDSNCYQLSNGRSQTLSYGDQDWLRMRSHFAIHDATAAAVRPPAAVAATARRPLVEIETRVAPTTSAAAPASADTTPVLVTPAAAVAVSRGWVLNVASLSSSAAAEREAQRLRVAGYAVAVKPTEVQGRNWYRVRLTGYASRAEAHARATEIGEKLRVPDVWASPD